MKNRVNRKAGGEFLFTQNQYNHSKVRSTHHENMRKHSGVEKKEITVKEVYM